MVYNEFQPIILAAGRGSRMTELTSNTPKCLLPVGGKPILCHTINTLEKAGFKDIIIIVLEEELNEIQQALNQNSVKVKFELCALPSDSEDWGTADSLRYILSLDKLKTDLLIVSCDLFTNASINKVLNTYRQHDASFVALFFLPQQNKPFQVPGIKSKYKPEKDIIGIDIDTQRLMFLASASDFEENVFINSNILKRHPRLNLRTDLTDGHFYLMSYKLAEYLTAEKAHSTFKGEFLPHVIGKQHVRKFVGSDDPSVVNEAVKKTLSEYMKGSKLEESIIEFSTFNDHDGDLKMAYHGDVVKCYAVVADQNEFGIRINSLQALCLANQLCTNDETTLGEDIVGYRINPSAAIESNQVDAVTFIGGNCKINEKTSLKASVLGSNCTIKPKTRISKCIFLKNVDVEERCVLENCIVANGAVIGSGSELSNCLIGSNYRVPEATKANCQVLTEFEGLMEI